MDTKFHGVRKGDEGASYEASITHERQCYNMGCYENGEAAAATHNEAGWWFKGHAFYKSYMSNKLDEDDLHAVRELGMRLSDVKMENH